MPTGPGAPWPLPLGELRAWSGRWLPDGKRIILTARAGSAGPYRLHELDAERGPPRLVSDVPLGTRAILVLSPDGQLAAAVDVNDKVVVVSLADGAPMRVAGIPPDSLPRGWAAPRELWLTEGADLPDATRLFRVDIGTGKVLEERRLGPPDASGAVALVSVQVNAEGREVVYTFNRSLGHLYILRGLPLRSQ